MELGFKKEILIKLFTTKMPYGKYKDTTLFYLPEHYIVWYKQKGFPKGSLGEMLETLYEIKLNGLEDMLKPLARQYDKR